MSTLTIKVLHVIRPKDTPCKISARPWIIRRRASTRPTGNLTILLPYTLGLRVRHRERAFSPTSTINKPEGDFLPSTNLAVVKDLSATQALNIRKKLCCDIAYVQGNLTLPGRHLKGLEPYLHNQIFKWQKLTDAFQNAKCKTLPPIIFH